jgi:FkbM family methyltransferase
LVKIFKNTKRSLIENLPNARYASVANVTAALRGHKHRISFDSDGGTITVSDGKDRLSICRRNRLWLYKRGIADRLDRLARSYMLDRITEQLEGAFVDCGANIGELGAWARARGLEYCAFEPEELEADCCDLNNFGGEARTNRFGLWTHDGALTFYSKPSTGDSSLFETKDYVDRREVSVRSLDSFAAQSGLKRVAVFKLEAEGAEPEILAGATETLKSTTYVAVDCGFERGLKNESTLLPVFNMLVSQGFQAVEWNPGRLTVLFRRENIEP